MVSSLCVLLAATTLEVNVDFGGANKRASWRQLWAKAVSSGFISSQSRQRPHLLLPSASTGNEVLTAFSAKDAFGPRRDLHMPSDFMLAPFEAKRVCRPLMEIDEARLNKLALD